MPTLANIEQCTGCAACSNACAHDAIKMQEDKEGFCILSLTIPFVSIVVYAKRFVRLTIRYP